MCQKIFKSECYEHPRKGFPEVVIHHVILFDVRQWKNSGWPLLHLFSWLLNNLVGHTPKDKYVTKRAKLFTLSCTETASNSWNHEPSGYSISIMECF